MQPNPWNRKIPEVRPYGAKTRGVERQISGSSYDFIIESLSLVCPISISPSFPPPPPAPFLIGLTQEVFLCLWLDEVFPQSHIFLKLQMDLALSLFLPEVSLGFSLHPPFSISPTPPAEGNPWRRSNVRQLCLLGSKITVVWVI